MGPIDQRIYTNKIYGDAIVQVLLVSFGKLFAGGGELEAYLYN